MTFLILLLNLRLKFQIINYCVKYNQDMRFLLLLKCKSLQRQVAVFDQTFAFPFLSCPSSQPQINHWGLNDPSIFTLLTFFLFVLLTASHPQLCLQHLRPGGQLRKCFIWNEAEDKLQACKPGNKYWSGQSSKTGKRKKASNLIFSTCRKLCWPKVHIMERMSQHSLVETKLL